MNAGDNYNRPKVLEFCKGLQKDWDGYSENSQTECRESEAAPVLRLEKGKLPHHAVMHDWSVNNSCPDFVFEQANGQSEKLQNRGSAKAARRRRSYIGETPCHFEQRHPERM